MSSETTRSASPVAPSLFSTDSLASEPTSDEQPDLGAFTTVLRAWTHLQPPPRILQPLSSPPTSTDTLAEHSTVWAHQPIAWYLNTPDPTSAPSPSPSPPPTSDSPSRATDRTVDIDHLDSPQYWSSPDADPHEHPPDQPSLGYLDEALSFIAAERARWSAQRERDGTQPGGAWRHVIEPRRKRRRKRPKPLPAITTSLDSLDTATPIDDSTSSTSSTSSHLDPDADHWNSHSYSSSSGPGLSSFPPRSTGPFRSTPGTPGGRRHVDDSVIHSGPGARHTLANSLTHSRSTPQLRMGTSEDAGAAISPKTRSRARGKLRLAPVTPGGVGAETEAADISSTVPSLSSALSIVRAGRKKTKLKPKAKRAAEDKVSPVRTILARAGVGVGVRKSLLSPVEAEAKAREEEERERRLRRRESRKEAKAGIDAKRKDPRKVRLQGLARQLQGIFPGEREVLADIVERLGEQHEEIGVEEEEIDTRGRAYTEGDKLVHVFIDHSNILIGLLSHLRKFPSALPLLPTPPPSPKPEAPQDAPNQPLPASKAKSSNATITPATLASAMMTTTHTPATLPRPNPKPGARPLPAIPNFSAKGVSEGDRARDRDQGVGEAGAPEKAKDEGADEKSADPDKTKPKLKVKKRLWHAALALILERGRPVSRRVLVTSSPLYQPMHGMERLGYEVRVYLRVPDLGDGMDRAKALHRRSGSGSGGGAVGAGQKRISGGSGSASGSGSAESEVPGGGGGLTRAVSGKGGKGGRQQQQPISGALVVASSGLSNAATPGNASAATGNVQAAPGVLLSGVTTTTTATTGASNAVVPSTATPPARVRYREQGVDELLQLKLHQALAATDVVPEGATIVLATGDGNVGQFNEDGFLGPVRTALRRGWRVELYAWEGGLSRAWRREFGEGSEWGRKGMFTVVGMEQFAGALVEFGPTVSASA